MRHAVVLTALAVVLAVLGLSQAQDPPPKYRGQLPAGWKKLGLDEKQVQAIYKIQTEHRQQIDKLETQIKKLKDQERAEMLKVLTPAQRDRLKELKATDTDPPKDTSKDK